MSRATRLLLGCFVVLALLPGSAAAAAPKAPSTFGIGPAKAGHLDARPFLSYGAGAGSRISDQVVVVNYSRKALDLTVIAADGVPTADGSFALEASAAPRRDVARWVVFDGPTRLHVPPQSATGPGSAVVPFTLRVPVTATPGDHFAGIAAVLTSARDGAGQPGVRLEQRVASRLYVRVSGPLRAQLAVEDLRATWSGQAVTGSVHVSYRVRNSGNVKLGAHQQVEVSGLFGPRVRLRPEDIPLLFPGSSTRVETDAPGLWPTVRLTAAVRLIPLRLQGDVDPNLPLVQATTHTLAIPWLLLALLLLGTGYVAWRRRGSRQDAVVPSAPVAVVGAALMVALGTVGPASAADVPYVDPQSSGSLTLCDGRGHELRSGSLTSQLAATAVAATAAPVDYVRSGTATLLAYQPREGLAPGQWSGELVTGASRFSTPQHPTAAVLPEDLSLAGFVTDFPPQWDGLVQLRAYLGAPGKPIYKQRYDTADIKVSGDRWTLVRGGGGSCGAGKAIAVTQILGVAATATPTPLASRPPAAVPRASRTAASGLSPASAAPAAYARRDIGGGYVLPLAGGGLVALVVAGVLLLARRRPANP